jgi:hypothetical protein
MSRGNREDASEQKSAGRKSSTGVPPVTLRQSELAGSLTDTPQFPTFKWIAPDADALIHMRQGARLPHWTTEGATYSVTDRLGDSLPRCVLEAWRSERARIVADAKRFGRPLTPGNQPIVAITYSMPRCLHQISAALRLR